MTCDVDEPVILKGTFTHPVTEEPIPPEEIDKVVCTVLTPRTTDETSSPDVDRSADEEGIYTARFVPNTHGKWQWGMDGFDADGEPIARAEGDFTARKAKVPRD